MKIIPFKVSKAITETIVVQRDFGKQFYNHLHQHSEIQLTLILNGEGTYIIGDSIGNFKPLDFFVIGEKLPHVFKNDNVETKCEMISIYFSPESFGTNFFELPEMIHLTPFFNDSLRGIKMTNIDKSIIRKIKQIEFLNNFQKFISFLNIISDLSAYEDNKEILSSLIVDKKYSEEEELRMDEIIQFALREFHRNILLEEVANIANMTPNAFCRYFKQRTNKTFVNFLTELRIGNACKLLSKRNELNIMDICYKSGFNNLANFNRKFKDIKGMTPSKYRQTHYK
ncbi:AraC family transcriptional regulator [Aureivirga sp. CE67]|uniref:AraC family transcriptional regulator n=1 Tax=Aureivirga sp. CE67 TaxID=1788983 RepID=UPI0018CA4C74|nr:AraC family transcriptional regulator [Aureivirga sp. CE67]